MNPGPKRIDTAHHHIRTDDLAFSAFLRMKGYRLVTLDQIRSKSYFTFETDGDSSPVELKVEFINSEFVRFYNELRNLKKMVSTH